jgi:ABC-type antimicrobial peptide transport system permease subunit
LYNFIASSINSKKKEIGILRAIGARGKDIAKIFIFEDIIIAIVNTIFSFIFIFIGAVALNTSLTRNFSSPLSILTVNPLALLFVALICIFVVGAASAIPLIRIIRMKPVDVIKTNG